MRADLAALGLALLAGACAAPAPVERATESLAPSPPPPVVADAGDAADAGEEAGAVSEAGDADHAACGVGDGGGEDAEAHAALGGFPEQLDLRDGNDELGVVSVPLGAREPRPIVVALHGGSERPERACSAWRRVTDAYPFVVCPRGWGGNERRLGWKNAADTGRRIARALAATKSAFGAWIQDTPSIVLAGFSMGAVQVALLARRAPQTYRRIVIGDAAHNPRSALTFAHAWVEGGGERALFMCTTSGCEPSMRAAARKVALAKGAARLNIAPTQKHALSEPVVQSLRRDWPWLVEGAEGWDGYAPPTGELPGKTETFEPR